MQLRHLRPVNGAGRSQPDLERSRRTSWGQQHLRQDLREEKELSTSMGQGKEHLEEEEHFLWGRTACAKALRPEQTGCVGRVQAHRMAEWGDWEMQEGVAGEASGGWATQASGSQEDLWILD